MKKAFWLTGAAVLALAQPASAGDTIKIGFVSTFSGPTAVIGNDMRNSFELALDHLGRKMGGKPVEVIYEDDGQKPDVGKHPPEARPRTVGEHVGGLVALQPGLEGRAQVVARYGLALQGVLRVLLVEPVDLYLYKRLLLRGRLRG